LFEVDILHNRRLLPSGCVKNLFEIVVAGIIPATPSCVLGSVIGLPRLLCSLAMTFRFLTFFSFPETKILDSAKYLVMNMPCLQRSIFYRWWVGLLMFGTSEDACAILGVNIKT
jgi:hypothetical protein